MEQQPGAPTQHCNPLWTNIEQGQWEEINIRSSAAPATLVAWSGGLTRRRPHDVMRRSMKGTTKFSTERERPREKYGCQTLASSAITMGRSTVERTCLTVAVNSCQNATQHEHSHRCQDGVRRMSRHTQTRQKCATSSTLSPELQELALKQHLP